MPRCIYPSSFNHFWDIAICRWQVLVENCDIFIPHLCLAAPQGWPRRIFAKILIHAKLEWMGYRVVKKAWQYIQPFWYSTSVLRTDRQTSSLYQERAHAVWLTHVKNVQSSLLVILHYSQMYFVEIWKDTSHLHVKNKLEMWQIQNIYV